jgi:hypothetical protein
VRYSNYKNDIWKIFVFKIENDGTLLLLYKNIGKTIPVTGLESP